MLKFITNVQFLFTFLLTLRYTIKVYIDIFIYKVVGT